MKKLLAILFSMLMLCTFMAFATACGSSENGKSAYDIWLDNGHIGTEADFLNWLKGDDGANGAPGQDGAMGATGATIEKVEVNEQGQIIITLTDGSVLEPVEIPDLHEFGEWQVSSIGGEYCEQKMFYRTCEDCGQIEWKAGSYEDHDFDVVTTEPT